MSRKNNNALFYTCSLIEIIGRTNQLRRSDVVKHLGEDVIQHIYNYSDIYHCEPIQKIADDFIQEYAIPKGKFDNVKSCVYAVPGYFVIGQVYERLIEDISNEDNIVEKLIEVYQSWIDEYISNYNIAVYYQSRDYILACYKHGEIL